MHPHHKRLCIAWLCLADACVRYMMKQQQLLKTLKRMGEGSPHHGSSMGSMYANATGPVRGTQGALRLGSAINDSVVKLQQRVSNANVGPLVATLNAGDSFGEEEILRDFDALPKESDLVKRRGGNKSLSVATNSNSGKVTPKTKAKRESPPLVRLLCCTRVCRERQYAS